MGGVAVTEEEAAFLATEIADNGGFERRLTGLLGSDKFWSQYDSWTKDMASGQAVPKEQSEWYLSLSRLTGAYIADARRALQHGEGPVSQNYRDTFPNRAAKAGTGLGGNLDKEEQTKYQSLVQYYNQ